MTSYVVADAGATKITWTHVTSGRRHTTVRTPGLNALLATRKDALANFSEAARALGAPRSVGHVYYFGTGCSTPAVCTEIAGYLSEIWPDARITVEGDALLAARSLVGDRRGVVCILGTGSNAVLADNGSISKSGAGLGYILGDNGAGSEIGKRLLSDYLKGLMPENVRNDFFADTGLTLETALENIYRRPFPNRYLASFAPFAARHRSHPYIRSIITDEFQKFISRDVIPLMKTPDEEVAFTGSIAKAFEDELRLTAHSLGVTNIGKIDADPMPGIIEYYSSKLFSSPASTES